MTKQSTTPPKLALRDLIANNSFAAAFQTTGQYRAALLKHDATERVQHAESFAWAVFAENGNVIIWSKNREQVEIASAKYGRPVVPVIALSAAQQAVVPGKMLAILRDVHDTLSSESDSDIDHFEDDEEEREGAPVQYAARKVMEVMDMLRAAASSAPGTPEAPNGASS